jgi:O-antigen/teichoic acid export membrane protein
MKKHSQAIAQNLSILVLSTILYFAFAYLISRLSWFQSLLKIVLEILWLGTLFYVTDNVQNLLYQKNKHVIGVNWEFRAKLITYSFTLLLMELAMILAFFLTPADDTNRIFAIIGAAGLFIAYLVIIIKNYFQSRKGLKGMSKEEVFE